MRFLVTVLAVLSLVFAPALVAQHHHSPDVTADELKEHVRFLTSDALQGRKAGSAGADKAAAYIADQFKADGLTPLGPNGSYLQKFEFISGVSLGPANNFTLNIGGNSVELRLDKDYRPLGFSSSNQFTGGVVFAGYGISAPDAGYDDYKSLHVADKAVIVLRYAPGTDSAKKSLEQYASLRHKASKAKELGAKMLIVVTGTLDSDKDDLIRLSYDQSTGNAGIPAICLTRAACDRILKHSGTCIDTLQNEITRSLQPHSMEIQGVSLTVQTDVKEIPAWSANVAGYLEGGDPVLKQQIVVIGAHYDHLGLGGEGSGSLKPETTAVHPGADDNASGTSGLLELAESLTSRKVQLRRSLLFIAFTGEEEGLLGSAYYVKNPLFPLDRTVTMINMDMIGRLNNRKLIIYGTGTSPEFDSLMVALNSDSTFALSLVRDGFGPSDQSSFYAKRIPVCFFFTDLHADYHRPSDTWDKLNYSGMERVVRFVEAFTLDVDREPAAPTYVAVETPKNAGNAGRSYRVYMGTIPDFGEQAGGMKISGVREGSPAAKAGLQGGDVIVKFGSVDIKNIYDFTFALGEHKPGDEVEVRVKRGDELLTMKVKLERRN